MTMTTSPAFLNRIFYKNKTFAENFESIQKYTFTNAFKESMCPEQSCGIIPKPLPVPIKQMDLTITMNPYTKTYTDIPVYDPQPEEPLSLTQLVLEMLPDMTSTPPTSTTQDPTGLCLEVPGIVAPPPPKQNTLYDPCMGVPGGAYDTLFWSIYIGVYGFTEYKYIKTNYACALLNEKKKIAQYLNLPENQKKMKTSAYKISKGGVQEIQSDCHTQTSTTNFPVVLAMSFFYEKNVWIIDETNRVYLKFHGKPEEEEDRDGASATTTTKIPCMIIYKTPAKSPRYTVETCPTQAMTEEIAKKMICLDHYDLPIKSASNYKMEDLEYMANVLGIETGGGGGKKLKKIDLYDLVKTRCIWTK
jgi:hypothetical protein